MVAEVKCLRAYFFFNLAFYYKDVPMPLKSLTLQEANSIAQTPQSEVYKQVENDLKEAVGLLPETIVPKSMVALQRSCPDIA